MMIQSGHQMILDGKRKTKMFQIVYVPRVQDEVVVAQFTTKEEAEAQMELIKEKRPKAYPHHYIKENNKEYPVDSSITKGTRMDDNYYYFRQKEKEDGSN